MNKVCRTCEIEQRAMDYYRQPSGTFMLDCKACWRAKVRANRLANIEHYREFDRQRANLPHRVDAREAYSQTERGRQASSAAKRRFVERNPLKKAASTAVNNAVRDGRLSKQPCEVCGKAQAQAHHDDYSKPLDVRWLCTTHHAEWHKHNTPLCPKQERAA
jgi:hypothetical protein